MAVKTVTIDMEAYDLLSRHKREGQSFSQVIKEHFSGAKKGRDLMAVLREVSLSEEALDTVEAQVKGRQASSMQGQSFPMIPRANDRLSSGSAPL